MKTFKLLKDGTINIKFQFGSQKDDFVIVNLNKKETRQIFDMVNKPKANIIIVLILLFACSSSVLVSAMKPILICKIDS